MMQCCSQVVTQIPQIINPAVIVAVLAGLTAILASGKKKQDKK